MVLDEWALGKPRDDKNNVLPLPENNVNIPYT